MAAKLHVFCALKLNVSEPSALLTEPSITGDKVRGAIPEVMTPTGSDSACPKWYSLFSDKNLLFNKMEGYAWRKICDFPPYLQLSLKYELQI